MNNMLLVSLFIAHVIGDFYLQNDTYCNQKEEKKLRSWFMYVHSVIMGALSWLLVPDLSFMAFAIFITVTHFFIDIAKSCLGKGLIGFVVDQLLHIGVLILISAMIGNEIAVPLQFLDFAESFSIPLVLLTILLCMKPANIIIKLTLERYKVGESASCTNMKNAGGLIGNLERILTIIFVLIGHYEAIGFIVAAKSILRFKDTDTAKTEYVLAGTFLSFGIAILCGLMAGVKV